MQRRAWILMAGALLASTGCVHRRTPRDAVAARDEAVRLDVINHYTLPMQIVAVGSGITYQLGTVFPGMSGHFVLPQALVGQVEFRATPGPGSEDLARSGELSLVPGRVVEFVISSPLFNSTARIIR